MPTGKYVVIEGHDGTGKSTQVSLLRERLAERGIDSIEFHEPEGTPIASAIRTVIKNGDLERDGMTNLLLFSAARHDIWNRYALPALKMGQWVVAARNYYSTLAYQGYGEGLDLGIIRTITEQATDQQYMEPDIALILNLDDEAERLKRIAARGELENPDTFESKGGDFQSKVKNAYLDIASNQHIQVLSASKTTDEVASDIWTIVEPKI